MILFSYETAVKSRGWRLECSYNDNFLFLVHWQHFGQLETKGMDAGPALLCVLISKTFSIDVFYYYFLKRVHVQYAFRSTAFTPEVVLTSFFFLFHRRQQNINKYIRI